jgi:hypothetical protein
MTYPMISIVNENTHCFILLMECEKKSMLCTCVPHQNFYKLQEWLVQKNDDKVIILIVDDDLDTLTVTANTAESWYLISRCMH